MGVNDIYMKYCDILECEIELTNICNMKCALCQRQYDLAGCFLTENNIDFNKWKEILDKCTSLQRIIISGAISEPTLYPELVDLLDYLNLRNITVYLHTNGETHDVKYLRMIICSLLDLNTISMILIIQKYIKVYSQIGS